MGRDLPGDVALGRPCPECRYVPQRVSMVAAPRLMLLPRPSQHSLIKVRARGGSKHVRLGAIGQLTSHPGVQWRAEAMLGRLRQLSRHHRRQDRAQQPLALPVAQLYRTSSGTTVTSNSVPTPTYTASTSNTPSGSPRTPSAGSPHRSAPKVSSSALTVLAS